MSTRIDDYDIDDRVVALLKDVELITETDKAILVLYDDEEVWLPLSMISKMDLEYPGDMGSVEIPGWLADEKGLS